MGNLARDGSVAVELVLQAVDAGYFVNVVSVYGDLPVTKSVSTDSNGLVKFWSVKAASSIFDPNPSNNQASFGFNSNNPSTPSNNMDKYPYDFPPDIKPPNQPPNQPPNEPPSPPNPPKPPNEPSKPLSRLGQDILTVRETVSTGDDSVNTPKWGSERNKEDSSSNSNTFDAIDSLKFILEWLLMIDDIQTILFFLGLIGIIVIWGGFSLPVLIAAIIFAVGFALVLYCLYLLYTYPKSS